MPTRKLALLAAFMFASGLVLTVAAYAVTH